MTTYMEPLPGRYDASDPFGNKQPPRDPTGPGHLGSDYPADAGTWFHIVADGVVVYNDYHRVLGWLLGVRCDDGKHVGYAHQLYPSPHDVNSRVSRGEWGGRVGNTGTASRGNHLHISLGTDVDAIWGGDVEDPYAYITTHQATAASGETASLEIEEETMPKIIHHIQGLDQAYYIWNGFNAAPISVLGAKDGRPGEPEDQNLDVIFKLCGDPITVDTTKGTTVNLRPLHAINAWMRENTPR